MNCWAVLGIDRTSDTAVIRKAYKQQLLVYHPEDDPEGYQKVREAYTAAMNAAKQLAKHNEANAKAKAEENAEVEGHIQIDAYAQAEARAAADHRVYRRLFKAEHAGLPVDDSEQDGGEKNEELLTVTPHHFFAHQEPVRNKPQAENDFMARLELLLNDQNKRNDPECWKELLSDDVLWDIHSKSRLDDRMLRLFSEQFNGLDDPIWKVIESYTGLFGKISRKSDELPARFVDTYVLATQSIAVPRKLKQANTMPDQILKKPDVSWWRYCFRIPLYWVFLMVIGNIIAFPVYLLSVLIRIVLFIFRRNWKIIMWEHTFTHINRWGKRYDFRYIDIIKIARFSNTFVIYLKGKRIRIKADTTMNLSRLIAKLSRYGTEEGNTIYME